MEGLLMSIIKLTPDEMRGISNAGQSGVEDHGNTYRQIGVHAEQLAQSSMQGEAGRAVEEKAVELLQSVQKHGEIATEKFQGITQFADRTEEAEHGRRGQITAISSL